VASKFAELPIFQISAVCWRFVDGLLGLRGFQKTRLLVRMVNENVGHGGYSNYLRVKEDPMEFGRKLHFLFLKPILKKSV
jgi:hypothetical protein